MNVEVKIVAPELAQALNNLAAAIAGRNIEAEPTADQEPVAEGKGKPTRARAAAKTEKTEPDTPPTSEETGTADTNDTASDQENAGSASHGLDYETDIKAPFLKLAAEKGRDAAVALLVPYKASSAQGVPEDKWPEFIDAISAASLA